MKTFGLDISVNSIKAVALKKNGTSFALDAVGYMPVSSKGIMSESLVDQQSLADSIKKLLHDANISLTAVNIAVPEGQIYSKIIEVPDLSDQELEAALSWEMDQYIPMSRDQVQTDWQILGRKQVEDKKLMDVLLVAAPLSILEKYENILTMSGLSAEAVESEMISVHRAVSPILTASESSMVVQMGIATTDVAVVKTGALRNMFSVGLGGLAITRSIASDLGIDVNQAEEYKKAYGLNKEMLEGKVAGAIMPILESIAGDLKKTMFSYKEKNQNEEIKQVVLSGPNALIPGIDTYLTNVLNAQVVLGNAWTAHSIASVPEELMGEFPAFTTAIGLGLREDL